MSDEGTASAKPVNLFAKVSIRFTYLAVHEVMN